MTGRPEAEMEGLELVPTEDDSSKAATEPPPQPEQVYEVKRGLCRRCCQWYCSVTTPSCRCSCCIVSLLIITLLLAVGVIKYLQWGLKHGGSFWTAIAGETIG